MAQQHQRQAAAGAEQRIRAACAALCSGHVCPVSARSWPGQWEQPVCLSAAARAAAWPLQVSCCWCAVRHWLLKHSTAGSSACCTFIDAVCRSIATAGSCACQIHSAKPQSHWPCVPAACTRQPRRLHTHACKHALRHPSQVHLRVAG